MTDDRDGIALAAKMLPFPRSISAEAQVALRRLVGADGIPVNSLHRLPAVDDHRTWHAVKARVEGQYAALAQTLSATLRSQAETIGIGETVVHVATPEAEEFANAALIDFHGGAFVFGGGEACCVGARMQADLYGIRCYGVDYRMPPDHPFPAALDDALATYRHVLKQHDPARIVVSGRSAGGNLAAALLLRARDEGLPLPAALVLLSPEVDLTESGDSFAVNAMVDVVLPQSLMACNRLYAGNAELAHPYLSPLFGDLAGFPPTLLQSGTRDLFLSNTVRLHRALRAAGVSADLHVFEAMPHGGFMGATPEDRELEGEVGSFIRRHLARPA